MNILLQHCCRHDGVMKAKLVDCSSHTKKSPFFTHFIMNVHQIIVIFIVIITVNFFASLSLDTLHS